MPSIFAVAVPLSRFIALLVASICGCFVLIKKAPKQVLHPKESVCRSYAYIPSMTRQSYGFVIPKQVSIARSQSNIVEV